MPLAVPIRRLAEAQERWRQTVENGTKYKVPGSEVEIDVWKIKNAMPSTLLGTNDGSRHAFDFLFTGVSSSQYAIDRKIALEFPYHSLDGNARLEWKNNPTERLELHWDQVREIQRDGDFTEIEIEQLGTTRKEALRRSVFHPNRLHTFLIVFNPKATYGYCLPASKLSSDYWNDEQFVYIPASEVAEFRFATTESDWFADLHQRIILPNAQCERPEHVFPENAIPEDYAITEEDEQGIEESLTEEEFSSYPWWKIERWNRRAAHTGWGVYIPLGVECKFANVVWIGYRWSVEDKERYYATQQLPVSFHQGDVYHHTTVLLIRVLLSHEPTMDFTTTVLGSNLEEGKFPCLYYMDCGSYRVKHIERSGLFIPSEYVDQDLLKKQHADLISKGIISGSQGAQGSDDALNAGERAPYIVNLERCLLAPCAGFHVREGKDFDNAVVDFHNAHVNDNKPLTWYEGGDSDLTATLEYTIFARDLWQAIAGEWIPGGIIKIPPGAVNQPQEDVVESDNGVLATQSVPRTEVWWRC